MARAFMAMGGSILTGHEVTGIRETSNGVDISGPNGVITANYVVACGGLMADRLARMMGIDIDFQIIPFRGNTTVCRTTVTTSSPI